VIDRRRLRRRQGGASRVEKRARRSGWLCRRRTTEPPKVGKSRVAQQRDCGRGKNPLCSHAPITACTSRPCWPDRGGAAPGRPATACAAAAAACMRRRRRRGITPGSAATKRQRGRRGAAAAARAGALFICVGDGSWVSRAAWCHTTPDES